MRVFEAIARATLWLSISAMCFLTFVWPFVVSPDPGQPLFKGLAITVLGAFLCSMLVLLACKVRRISR